jgi:septal ring factor EnvC (AmiA/AmiB activator)
MPDHTPSVGELLERSRAQRAQLEKTMAETVTDSQTLDDSLKRSQDNAVRREQDDKATADRIAGLEK